MIKKILVPTDYSKNADVALNYAVGLARKADCKIVLFHSSDTVYFSPGMPARLIAEEITETGRKAEMKLHALCEKIKKKDKLNCEFISVNGPFREALLHVTAKEKPDFIVMGTRGAGGIKKVFVGSNTAAIIGEAPCPVFAIPARTAPGHIKEIIYASDYHAGDISALRQLADIARIFDAHITVLHVAGKEYTKEYEEEYIAKFSKKMNRSIKYEKAECLLLFGSSPVEVIEKYIKNHNCDLFAMSTHSRSFLARVFGGGTTKKMLYHTSIPFAAFRNNDAPFVV